MARQPTEPNYSQPALLTREARNTIMMPAPKTVCECTCLAAEPPPAVINQPSLWPLSLVLAVAIVAAIYVWRHWPRPLP